MMSMKIIPNNSKEIAENNLLKTICYFLENNQYSNPRHLKNKELMSPFRKLKFVT